jgi:hypothetical protein
MSGRRKMTLAELEARRAKRAEPDGDEEEEGEPEEMFESTGRLPPQAAPAMAITMGREELNHFGWRYLARRSVSSILLYWAFRILPDGHPAERDLRAVIRVHQSDLSTNHILEIDAKDCAKPPSSVKAWFAAHPKTKSVLLIVLGFMLLPGSLDLLQGDPKIQTDGRDIVGCIFVLSTGIYLLIIHGWLNLRGRGWHGPVIAFAFTVFGAVVPALLLMVIMTLGLEFIGFHGHALYTWITVIAFPSIATMIALSIVCSEQIEQFLARWWYLLREGYSSSRPS